jgi:hypothetical protein
MPHTEKTIGGGGRARHIVIAAVCILLGSIGSLAPDRATAQDASRIKAEMREIQEGLAAIRRLRPDDVNYPILFPFTIVKRGGGLKLVKGMVAVPSDQWYQALTGAYTLQPEIHKTMSLAAYLKEGLRVSNTVKALLKKKRAALQGRWAALRRALQTGAKTGKSPTGLPAWATVERCWSGSGRNNWCRRNNCAPKDCFFENPTTKQRIWGKGKMPKGGWRP